MRPTEALKVVVGSSKGGCQKTTTTVALAAAARRSNLDVITYDADVTAEGGNLAQWAARAKEVGDPLPWPVLTMHTPAELDTRGAEVVIVDTPPLSTGLIGQLAEWADTFVLPVSPSLIEVDRMNTTVREVAQHGLGVAVLLTKVRPGTAILDTVAKALAARDDIHLVRNADGAPIVVPERTEITWWYGASPGSSLHGYQDVWAWLWDEWTAATAMTPVTA